MTHPFMQLYDKSRHILAIRTNRRISLKDSREIAKSIKNKKLVDAINYLERVIKLRQPVEFMRYTEGAGHKKGIRGGGRYPINASKEILKMLKSILKEGDNRGWETNNIYIKYFVVSKGYRFSRPRRDRFRPQKAKSTNLYVLCEVKGQ